MARRRRRPDNPDLVKQAEKFISDADPNLEKGSDAWNAAVFLLVAANVGPSINRVTKESGLKEGQIRTFVKNLKKNGMWIGGRKARILHSGWFDEGQLGAIAFWIDVNIALGFIEKVGKNSKGQALYESSK